jgi:DNA-binding transcriptional LysR family regulator
MKLDPVSLRLFVTVVEEGTIAAAAEREHIAAAAVSKRLSDLERLLSTQLLWRNNKGITPTAAGISLLYRARSVLNDLSDIVENMKEYSHGRRGSIRVLVNISAITQFMPPLLKSFMELYPLVEITLEEKRSLAIAKAIADDMADIGVLTCFPHNMDVELFPFRTDELIVLVPVTHPLSSRDEVSFAETLDYDHVGLCSGTHLNFQLIKAANDAGRALRLRMEVSNYDALCLLVQAGIGIGILPRASADIYMVRDTKMLVLKEPWSHRELAVCVRSKASLAVASRLLFDHLLTH